MIKIRIRNALVLFVIGCVLPSCLTTSSFETGRTLGQGVVEDKVTVSVMPVDVDGGILDLEGIKYWPTVAISSTLGVTDRLDLGFRGTLWGDAGIKAKFMVTPEYSKFAVSLGSSIMFSVLNDEEYSSSFLTYRYSNFNIHSSYHFNETIAFYFTPRYFILNKHLVDAIPVYGFSTGLKFDDLFIIGTHNSKYLGLGIEYSEIFSGVEHLPCLSVGFTLQFESSRWY